MAVIIVKLGDNVIQTFELGQEPAKIGRARDNDIIVENLSVSRHHATIQFEDGKYLLIDNKSANGVFVNGVKINRAELADNDIVSIGKHRLHYSASGSTSRITQEKTQIDENAKLEPIKGQDGIDRIPYLTVTRGNLVGLTYPMTKLKSTIGRSHQNDIRINDWLVSRKHASITYQNGTFKLEDLGSWHGTTVNSESIREKDLKADDEILMCNSLLKFSLATPDEVIEDSKLFSFTEGQVSATNGKLMTLPIAKVAASAVSNTGGGGGDGVVLMEDPRDSFDEIESSDHVPSIDDDEFAPMTQEELEALEMEADEAALQVDPEMLEKARLEDLEAKRLQEEGGGWSQESSTPLVESDEKSIKDEASNFEIPETAELVDDPVLAGDDNVHLEDAEEEKGLFGGPVENVEPGSIDATPKPIGDSDKEEISEKIPVAKSKKQKKPGDGELVPVPDSKEDLYVPEGVDPKKVQKWWRGLRNKKQIIRKEAARKLKELTGIDYDWESGPTE